MVTTPSLFLYFATSWKRSVVGITVVGHVVLRIDDLVGVHPERRVQRSRDDTDAGLEVEAQAFVHLIATDDVMEGISKLQSDEDPEFEGK